MRHGRVAAGIDGRAGDAGRLVASAHRVAPDPLPGGGRIDRSRDAATVCSAVSHWVFTKKNVLFRLIGPPTLNPGMCCVNIALRQIVDVVLPFVRVQLRAGGRNRRPCPSNRSTPDRDHRHLTAAVAAELRRLRCR